MIRIAIVEDHILLAQSLSNSLTPSFGFNVVSINYSAQSFIDTASTESIDIAIIDFNLPDIDGSELCSIIKRDFPEIKVIGFTLHESLLYFDDMMSKGAMGYVLKNDGLEELKNAIFAVNKNLKYYSQGTLSMILNRHLFEKSTNKFEPKLSTRQQEIIDLIAKGATTKEIAALLFLSEATVATHRNNIMKKLNVHNVAGIINYSSNKFNLNQ